MIFLRRLFHADEIRASSSLRAIYWVLLTGFFLSFQQWIKQDAVTLTEAAANRHTCLPYFPGCDALYFFDGLPDSYGQNLFYALLAGFLLASALFAWKDKWEESLALLVPPFLWKLLYVGALTHTAQVDFEYFHIPPLFFFLFARHKLYFLRRGWVLVYLLAATMKFNESWIVGNYFTSLRLGMPLVADPLVPWITNGVALFEIVSPWLLLSPSNRLRYGSLALWLLFHLYSVVLVEFRYPLHCTPLLLALFLPQPSEEEMRPDFSPRAAFGWVMLAALFFVGLLPRFLPGDKLYTLQGIKFGVGMFDANHQCVSTVEVNGEKFVDASGSGMNRCGVFPLFYRLQRQRCGLENRGPVRWTFASSVNGGPFYKLVDAADACALEYKAFGHNEWVKDPSSGAEIVGYPRENVHARRKLREDDLIFDTQAQDLTPLQQLLQRNLNAIAAFWWVVWAAVFAFVCVRRLRINI